MRTGCGIVNKYKCECKLRSDNISLIGTKTLTDQNLPMLRVRLALARSRTVLCCAFVLTTICALGILQRDKNIQLRARLH